MARVIEVTGKDIEEAKKNSIKRIKLTRKPCGF